MIDLNYLHDLSKLFSKEAAQCKFLFNVYNEIKSESQYIKSIVEIENKSLETITKTTLGNLKNFANESALLSSEDVTNSVKLMQTFCQAFEAFFNELNINLINSVTLVTKFSSEISE